MGDNFDPSITSTSAKPVEFDGSALMEIKKQLENMPELNGLVLIPSGAGFDMYKFPVSILKGAINLMFCE